MKKLLLVLIIIATSSNVAFSIEVYWADTLFGVSSQFVSPNSSNAFSGSKALGKPNIMPDFGQSKAAWMTDKSRNPNQWIKVGFKNTIESRQLIISESFNPGGISRIIVTLADNTEKEVFRNLTPEESSSRGRINNVFFDAPLRISAVKIEFLLNNFVDNIQIDAIGLSASTDKFELRINSPSDMPEKLNRENLGSAVNSLYPELGPIITADGKKLFFTRDSHPDNLGTNKKQDVWMSEKDSNGVFAPAVNLNSPVNNEKHNFIIGSSQDGNIIFLGAKYFPDGSMAKGISMSYRRGNGWTFPENTEIEDHYNKSPNESFSFGANGKVMIVSAERDDSYGGTDLYVSFFGANGKWSAPKNLGSTVNSTENDESPFLATDGTTLYFSSEGFPGYGSNDMFVTRRLDDTWTNWSEPQNLGTAINTPDWDSYYTIAADGKYAYYVSSFNSIGREDIFRIEIPESVKPRNVVLIKGKVLNSKTKQPLKAKIFYEILKTGFNAGNAVSDSASGDYTIALPEGEKYAFRAEAEGFVSVNENIDLTNLEGYEELNYNLSLVPIESGQKVRLNNIFFEFGKSELLDESIYELDRVVALMNTNQDMRISIEGHTDNVGSASANNALSRARAKAVFDYLAGKGIAPKRLSFVGHGASRPISANTSEKGRDQNRRVEFVIK